MGFSLFMRILRARAALILATAAAFLALGLALALALPKRYDATASVMVDQKAAADVLSGTNSPQSPGEKIDNVISTNIDILSSPGVALKVIDALKLESNPQARELLNPSGPLATAREWAQHLVSSLLPEEPAEDTPPSLKDWMADRMLHNLNLKSNRDSRIIRVTYSSPDPQFSTAAANAFVSAYRATLLQLQVGPARENTQWLDQQTRELKQNLEQAEARLAKYQQEKGIVATDERLDVETGRLAELSAQLAAAQSLSYESQARQRHLREFLKGGGGEAPAEVSASPVVQQLKASVAEREAKLSELSKKIGPNHPQYVAAATELEKLRTQLNDEMRNAAQSQLTSAAVQPQREGAMRGALEGQRSRVLKMKNDRNEVAALARDVDTAQRAYTAAAQRMSQTRMESQLANTNGAVVDAATVPRRPASPNVPLILVLALAVGTAIGVGCALFSETVNRLVRSEYDLAEVLGLPVLAVLAPKRIGKSGLRRLPAPALYSLPKM